jgi:hypothetical protein
MCGDKILYDKLMLKFIESDTTYVSGGNMFRLIIKSSSSYPVN